MNEEKMNRILRRQIEAETPDMLDELFEEMGPEPVGSAEESHTLRSAHKKDERRSGKKVSDRRRAGKGRRYLMRFVAAAAALLIAFFSGRAFGVRGNSGVGEGGENQTVMASITLDVNPSVEIEIGSDKRVISCRGLNEEGKTILKEMNLTGADVTVAAYAVVGGMVTNGYLTDAANSVLVRVRADEKEEGRSIEKSLSEDLNAYLENSSIGAAIIGQYVQADDQIKAFADENGISEGKAWIIRQLAASDKRMKEESLLKLSTQELLVLWTAKGNGSSPDASDGGDGGADDGAADNSPVLYGTVSTRQYVGKKRAVAAALEHVGIKRPQAENVEVDFECEDGVIIYEVDFTYNGREYEIDIQADTGTVMGGGPGETSVLTGTPAAGTYDDDDDRYESGDDDDDDDDRYESDDDDDD